MCFSGHDQQTAVDVQSGDQNAPLGLESGLDALRSSPEFRGPVESLGDHDPNEHLAVIYEDRDEQFAAVVPFMRQLLERNYRDDLDADAREYVDFAVGGADRMREMIDGLLEFSRIDTGETTLEPVDCEAVVETVVTDHQVQIEESGATVEIGSLPTVEGDQTQLEQLFSNLIGNAIKYRGDGPPHIEIGATKRNSEWRLTVADNGIGIDPEYHDQIFDVFNRLHAIGEFPGTGIGLALCRRIVVNHGGDIGVDSESGAGTTFTVTLPATAPNP